MLDKKIHNAVLAALGVIEDDIGESIPLEEIAFSLRADFQLKMSESKIANILQNLEKDGYVKFDQKKYSLTLKSQEIVDGFLEAQNI